MNLPRAHANPAWKPRPERPHGRTLKDFKKLWPAEVILLSCCQRGEVAEINKDRPLTSRVSNRVRGDFLRFLLLGGDSDNPVHEKGVFLCGAWIVGGLDLESATVVHRIRLINCRISRISLEYARIRCLDLDGCLVTRGIKGDGLRCEDDITLRNGFHATGEICLLGAVIGGDFNCKNGKFDNPDKGAITCDRATILGSVFLRNGFRATGTVRFSAVTIRNDFNCTKGKFQTASDEALFLRGATIGGSLDCAGATFIGGKHPETGGQEAILLGRAKITGSVYFRDGFRATGRIRLWGTVIGGNLDCEGGSFEYPKGEALACDGMQVTRLLRLRGATSLEGGVSLVDASVGSLSDNTDSWEDTRGRVVLDGFTYERLVDAPTQAEQRIDWLTGQIPAHLQDEFRPQPWEQLISVLKSMGHGEEARAVSVAKHKAMRKACRYVGGSLLWDGIYGTLIDYGYRPWKLFRIALGVWLAGAFVYWAAANPAVLNTRYHALGPPRAEPNLACLAERAADRDRTPCPSPTPRYGDFFALTYSLEVMLPVISLGGKERWQPVVSDRNGEPLVWGHVVRAVYWLQTAFGWLAGLLLVGTLGTLIKRD